MEYIIHLAILISIYSILSVSLNLIVGYTGLLSVAHASFYGIGAYVTGIVLTRYDIGFFTSIFLGIIITSIIAFFIGLVQNKFRDDYYVLVSVGFGGIMYGVYLNWQELTRGPLGIPGIDRPIIFGINLFENSYFLILTIITAGIIYFIARSISTSSFGRVLKAIREDEEAIQVFGYHTFWYKLVVFVIGAAMASVAGALFASYISYIDPSMTTLLESILILSIIILGGLANLRGALLGTIFLMLLPEALRFVGFPTEIAGQMRQAIYGLLLVVLMIYRPQGLLGEYKF